MRTKFKIGGRNFSLNDIETNEIRKQFQEQRIHFAIVCASRGCPWLSPDAFTGERSDAQCSRKHRAARARPLTNLQWYQQDFVISAEGVLAFISKYRTVTGRNYGM